MGETTPERRSLFLELMLQLRGSKVTGWLLGILIVLTLASVICSNQEDQPWKIIGGVGTVLFPLILAAWQVGDVHAESIAKKERDHEVSRRVKGALGPLGRQLKEIAETPQDGWIPNRVLIQREGILNTVVKLLEDAGVPEPRVCLYKVNLDAENTDDEGNQDTGDVKDTVDELSYVTHRGGTSKPKDLYRRTTTRDRKVSYSSRRNRDLSELVTEPDCGGLFEPIETQNHTRENSRSDYDATKHKWRSSVRFPIFTGRDVEHLLTVDTKVETGIPVEHDELILMGAAILRLLSSVVDDEIPLTGVGERVRIMLEAAIPSNTAARG